MRVKIGENNNITNSYDIYVHIIQKHIVCSLCYVDSN